MTTSAEEDCGEMLTWHLRPPKQGYDSNEGVGSVCVFVCGRVLEFSLAHWVLVNRGQLLSSLFLSRPDSTL